MTKRLWAVVRISLGCVVAGWWLWNERPATAQAAISTVRDASNQSHVMTVEAISEGGEPLVGRSIAILNARVTEVTGPRTFWVVGSEAGPLLVVVAPSRDPLKLAPGEHVSLNGVVRAGPSKFSLGAEDQVQLAKANLHVLATDLRRLP